MTSLSLPRLLPGLLLWATAGFSQTKPAPPDSSRSKVYSYRETMPVFPGGSAALLALLTDSLRYPPRALRDGVAGKVYLAFTVGPTGEVTTIFVKQGVRADLDAEALRNAQRLTAVRWQPGTQNGRPVSVVYTVPLTFSLGNLVPPTADSLDLAHGPAVVLPTGGWPASRTALPADKGVIYGRFVQRLGFSSGGLGQYVRLINLDTHKAFRILVKPVLRSRKENEFCVALPPGRYALYEYEYSYGVDRIRKGPSGPLAATRYTFLVRPGQLHHVGTWDFSQPQGPSFSVPAQPEERQSEDFPKLPLATAVLTLPQ